ncbi:DNA-binding transcriptional regulator, ArsR family [Rhizobium sp. NFR07]|jgi:DNA-binding transcriptional ArsR family regulator|uniref:ArsR/SmtB family transcription factor n=1 Tax=Rhizobium sp. NFR07 TaxID=1566262 RepID=UPI0008EB9B7C|nr:metalloregulator ArsR/SmtB family transcription factor [Rhizobium sp. NFR07]SFB63006.1 DNA-binding transcriptional regulator, ArsR family [Rhizobium sp. NFR07]
MTGEYSFCSKKAARLIHVLAHDSRLKIMALVAQREWDVTSLARETKLAQPALSRHLKKMRDTGLVQTRREAQTIYYSCTDASVARLVELLTQSSLGPVQLDKDTEHDRTTEACSAPCSA